MYCVTVHSSIVTIPPQRTNRNPKNNLTRLPTMPPCSPPIHVTRPIYAPGTYKIQTRHAYAIPSLLLTSCAPVTFYSPSRAYKPRICCGKAPAGLSPYRLPISRSYPQPTTRYTRHLWPCTDTARRQHPAHRG